MKRSKCPNELFMDYVPQTGACASIIGLTGVHFSQKIRQTSVHSII